MSAHDPWNDSQNAPSAPARKPMSGCMLAAIIVGGLGLVCIVACCGGTMWFGSMFIPKEVKIPAEVAETSRQILNITVLPDFSPDKGLTSDNMFYSLKIVTFTHKENKGEILMGAFKVKMGDANQAKMQTQPFRAPFEEKSRGSLDIKSTESREITINGQKVTISIGEAIDRSSGKPVHTVSADFVQPDGKFTFFFLRMDDDVWDEEAALKMLEDAQAP